MDESVSSARRGVVTSFDDHVALGAITGDDGSVWPFHCVSIADGSRTILAGTRVQFDVTFHVSRDEAINITPL